MSNGKIGYLHALIRFIVLMCLAIAFVRVNAQKEAEPKPSFAGTWRLDKSKETDEDIVGDLTLVIEHNDPEIKFIQTVATKLYSREGVMTYYTDRRGEENTENGSAVKSKTKWDGRSVIVEISAMLRVAGDRIDITRIEKWQLSKDGNSLKQTITTRRTSSNAVASIHPAFIQSSHTFNKVP